MRKESSDLPSTLEMGGQLLDQLNNVRAHYTVIRKPGHQTSGMTYEGLHQTIVGARKARQDKANSFSQTLGRQQEEANQLKQVYLESTEINQLKKGQEYPPHGLGGISLTHGENDGTHGSTRAETQDLIQNQ